MGLPEHRRLQHLALQAEAQAEQALFAGNEQAAQNGFQQAATLYRGSFDAAPPVATGRLIGMLKASVLAGSGEGEAAALTRASLPATDGHPERGYTLAIASLIDGDYGRLGEYTDTMRSGGPEFERAADAIAALAAGQADTYRAAVTSIINDFEQRKHYVAKVPIADTALMLEHLAEPRGLAAHPRSALLPGDCGSA